VAANYHAMAREWNNPLTSRWQPEQGEGRACIFIEPTPR
jgi:hypothetical protein